MNSSSQASHSTGAAENLAAVPTGSGDNRSEKRRIAVDIHGSSATVTITIPIPAAVSKTASLTSCPVIRAQMASSTTGTNRQTSDAKMAIATQSIHTAVADANARKVCTRDHPVRGGESPLHSDAERPRSQDLPPMLPEIVRGRAMRFPPHSSWTQCFATASRSTSRRCFMRLTGRAAFGHLLSLLLLLTGLSGCGG